MKIGALIETGPSDWQILQQENGKADIRLSGSWAAGDDMGTPTVYVRLVREDSGTVIRWWTPGEMAEGNRWSAVLTGIPAGGLYRLETCLAAENGAVIEWAMRGDMVHHLGVGDLYVIAGQSNSAGYGKDPVFDPPQLGVHLLKNSGKWDLATHPMNDSTNMIHEANREGCNSGTSPYLSFGKLLQRELGYPIGLIQASLGGSPLSAWDHTDAVLYHNMMDIIHSQTEKIKGVLWYQGCSDAEGHETGDYLERFTRMVANIRREMGEEIPVLTFQLNRLTNPGGEEMDREWGLVREAQRQAALRIPGVMVVPTTDSGLSDEIHNSSAANVVLGERMAISALRHIYGRSIGYDAPDLEKACRTGEKNVELTFAHVGERLLTFNLEPENLAIAVEDAAGENSIAEYTVEKNRIILTLVRTIQGDCLVSGASRRNPRQGIPMDVASHLPILSFYGIKAQ